MRHARQLARRTATRVRHERSRASPRLAAHSVSFPRTSTRHPCGLFLDCSAAFRCCSPAAGSRRRRRRRRRLRSSRPLAGLAGQRVVVTPVYSDARGRPARLGARRSRDRASTCARSTTRSPAELARARARDAVGLSAPISRASTRANPTYAVDPYALAVEPLRDAGRRASGAKIADPLATQLRTMIALHDSRAGAAARRAAVRPGPAGQGIAVLRARARGRAASATSAGSARCASDPSPDLLARAHRERRRAFRRPDHRVR